MKEQLHRKYFCRIHKTNILKDGTIYEYDFKKIYLQLMRKGYQIISIIHEKGEKTEHYHFIIQHNHQISTHTLLKIMPYGKIEKQKGSNLEAYNYLLHIDPKSVKNGKKEYSPEEIQHNLEDIEFWKSITQGKRTDLEEIITAVEEGKTHYEIFKELPHALKYSGLIERVQRALNEEKAKQERQPLTVKYFYGDTATGKSFTALNSHDKKDIFKITNYQNPFDNYKGQNVLILEEYHSNFTITQLLDILDHYPQELNARYYNNYACWNIVYIISNKEPQEQYPNIDPRTKKAFYRRITTIQHFTPKTIYNVKYNLTDNIFETINEQINPLSLITN